MGNMSLKDAMEHLRSEGIEICLPDGWALEDFLGYYRIHYAPNIDKQQVGKFFADDMRALLGAE